MNTYRTIGVLGGMGPEATAELYKRIVSLYQDEKGAVDDADFPSIIINSVPAADMLNDLEGQNTRIIGQLNRAAQVLERAGADFIAIPCNTAMIFLSAMQASVTIPIIDITEITAEQAARRGDKKVGLLASTSTIKNSIYKRAFDATRVSLLTPDEADQETVEQIIMRLLAGKKRQADRVVLQNLAIQMKSRGVDSVVLGCTELPLLIDGAPGIPLIDTIQVLAEAVLERAELTPELNAGGATYAAKL
jgi:aspartate racemase